MSIAHLPLVNLVIINDRAHADAQSPRSSLQHSQSTQSAISPCPEVCQEKMDKEETACERPD